MTPAERLIAQIRAQRTTWITLEPAASESSLPKRVQIVRPPETAVVELLAVGEDGQHVLKVKPKHVSCYVVGWSGFTEADLIGPAGGSEIVPFDQALWDIVVEDEIVWVHKISRAILDVIVAHQSAKADDEKN